MSEVWAVFLSLLAQGRYFEAHELLEEAWREAGEEAKPFLQALILLAAALHQEQEGRSGARNLAKAEARLLSLPSPYLGLDWRPLLTLARLRIRARGGGMPIAQVLAYRGDLVENRHRASIAVVGQEGLLAYAGEAGLWAYMRSSAKPFQALALFLTGAVERFGLGLEEVALATASHDGTPEHLEVAQRFLDKLGLDLGVLVCGVHPPFDREARKALEAQGLAPTVLHHNCSGKHLGMLAAALALGAPVEGYHLPDHPVQVLNRQVLGALAGRDPLLATDGCSVPTFALPLLRAARAFYLLARPEEAPGAYREALARVGEAMRRHPRLVAGPRSLDTLLMERLPLLAKRGADGYYGLALPQTPHGPLGVALKVEDGSGQAREVLVLALLRQLGLDPGETPWDRPVLKNHRGLEVGHLEAHLDLAWV